MLTSLRYDVVLQAHLSHPARLIAEGIVDTFKSGTQNQADGRVLELLLDAVHEQNIRTSRDCASIDAQTARMVKPTDPAHYSIGA